LTDLCVVGNLVSSGGSAIVLDSIDINLG